jgi:uncharacterized protein (TIGR03546 family)
VSALNSQGTPGQVAAGIALGACLGITPLVNLHNLAVYLLAYVVNVSLAGFSLGWMAFIPVGFLLDPLFNKIGEALLSMPALRGFWSWMMGTPVLALSHLNNTVVLGSFVFWLVASVPIFFLARYGVTHYRAKVYERLKKMRFFQALQASSLMNVYHWFKP